MTKRMQSFVDDDEADYSVFVNGWLQKLNKKGNPEDVGDWRDRLCFCADGVVKYISEKADGEAVVMYDMMNIKSVERCSFSPVSLKYAFKLIFFDDSRCRQAQRTGMHIYADRHNGLSCTYRVKE